MHFAAIVTGLGDEAAGERLAREGVGSEGLRRNAQQVFVKTIFTQVIFGFMCSWLASRLQAEVNQNRLLPSERVGAGEEAGPACDATGK
jgi:hypothetical protein